MASILHLPLEGFEKIDFLRFSAPGGGDRELLRRLVSQPGVTEGTPQNKEQNRSSPRGAAET
jgi:hypothetical protein